MIDPNLPDVAKSGGNKDYINLRIAHFIQKFRKKDIEFSSNIQKF